LRYECFEVVVVNGPSTDDTLALLEQHADGIKIGHCPETNLSMSRNIGLALASGEVVSYIDDDAVPEPDWLNALASLYSEPDVGAVGGFIRDHTGFTFQCKVTACDRFADAETYESMEEALASGAVCKGVGAARYLSPTGANSSFRRSALAGIGGFDEEFAYFLDETDVALRLIDQGWKVLYSPSAEVHHKYASSDLRDANRIPKSIYLPARSKAYFVMRHAGSSLGLSAAFDYIVKYQLARRRDHDWLLSNGLIEADRRNQLDDDVARGSKQGVSDAFMYPDGRLQTFSSPQWSFKRFTVLRPADRRLQVCFLSQDYPPGPVGGIAMWTYTLAVALAARGHEVSVITRGRGHARVDFEQGVWVHRIPQEHQPGRSLPNLPDLPTLVTDWCFSAYDEVLRIRVRRGLNLVSAPIWDVEGAACLADGTLPVVTSLHSTYKLVLPSKRKWQEDAKYRRLHVDKLIGAEAWMLERSQLILANSEAILSDIEGAYGLRLNRARVQLVPHGLAPEAPAALPSREPGCRILYVGRFETRKGIDVLAEAIPVVLAAQPEARFVLVGDPDVDEDGRGPTHRAQIEELLARHPGRVEMTGVLSREELIAEYARADVFVAPSRYESFGLIFLEAMMHGAACVGTRAGGIPEVVEDGVTGLLVPPADPCALADALTRLVGDPALRARLGQAGLAAYRGRFTAGHMAELVEAEYAAMLRSAADSPGKALPAGAATPSQIETESIH
jgi:glycosyltransferase involved in cell wall biosynthesis/GT2 family glycosyltransferase